LPADESGRPGQFQLIDVSERNTYNLQLASSARSAVHENSKVCKASQDHCRHARLEQSANLKVGKDKGPAGTGDNCSYTHKKPDQSRHSAGPTQ
jgi:hypothetical protein